MNSGQIAGMSPYQAGDRSLILSLFIDQQKIVDVWALAPTGKQPGLIRNSSFWNIHTFIHSHFLTFLFKPHHPA